MDLKAKELYNNNDNDLEPRVTSVAIAWRRLG